MASAGVSKALSLFLLVLGVLFANPILAAQACNGHSELCSRKYSNVTQIGSHDSAFVGTLLTDNQHLSVTDQLNRGIRFLTVQTHEWSNTIQVCHTSCVELNVGTFKSYLTTIKSWLDASNSTNEVLTLLVVNNDDLSAATFGSVFKSVGLDKYAFAPSGTLAKGDWPTLQQLITAKQRLVVFMDYQADTSSVSYILPEWTYFFETPYDVTDTSDFNKCPIDRPAGSSPNGKMSIVNHFLDVSIFGIDIPDEGVADTTNSKASIVAQANVCIGLYGVAPKAILVDWMDMGNVFAAERYLNGLS
jgi:hypothetical protein